MNSQAVRLPATASVCLAAAILSCTQWAGRPSVKKHFVAKGNGIRKIRPGNAAAVPRRSGGAIDHPIGALVEVATGEVGGVLIGPYITRLAKARGCGHDAGHGGDKYFEFGFH